MAFVSFVIYAIFAKVSYAEFIKNLISTMSDAVLTGNVFKLGYNQALWFLPMIFLSNIIFYGVIKLSSKLCTRDAIKNLSIVAISIIISCIGKIFINKSIMLWSIDIALFTMTFNALGYLLFKYSHIITQKFKSIYLIPLSIILVIFSMKNIYVNLAARSIGNPLVYYSIATLAILIMFKICNILVRYKNISRILKVCSINSIFILCYHLVLHNILYTFIVPTLPENMRLMMEKPNLLIGTIVIILEIIIPIAIGHVLHRKRLKLGA